MNEREKLAAATDLELEQWAIPVNAGSNPIHEAAALELRRRGYLFDPTTARWQKVTVAIDRAGV